MTGRFIRLVAAPLLLALGLTACMLALMGVDPLAYFGLVVQRGLLSPSGLQAAITRMAPLLLVAASLILAFRAGIWNLGGDGQYLLGAVIAAAIAPALAGMMPHWLAWLVCFAAAAVTGAVWSLLPAWLRARRGVNEVVSSLMMSFLGLSLANVLIKFVFQDPGTTVPQTVTLPVADRLPRIGDGLLGGAVSSGVLVGLLAVLLVHGVMTRTAFGLRLRIVGANARAAVHAGLDVPRLTMVVFGLSAGLAGLAGAVDVLGIQGNVRAGWNPAYGLMVVPLVFLARFNGFAAIVFVFLFSVLSVGGESAARRLGVPNYVTLVTVAILLIGLAVGEALDRRRRATKAATA
ncbi:putative B6 ABC transporter permease subunit 2 [Pseudochelatococcus contaminans]|uniref:Simple sugar transport system permease protein n=1 Tax=Pseudochelatococcus contaminans TaxID=1538103 RepID=A0A7W6EFU6_9HYPH|nr:ABC transporter permease [Pseudochelatococcus contaminans]MBB3809016.1 simple sugar transport system permease protein [Pseudochelatococcus contaminans]